MADNYDAIRDGIESAFTDACTPAFGGSTDDLVYNAIRRGVREAIENAIKEASAKHRSDEILDAVREGVYDAMWQMITNATDGPCGDFYRTVGDAVKEAVENIATDSFGKRRTND